MPTGRSATAWGVHTGLIYVAGGEQRTSRFQRTFSAVDAYNPANNRWTQLPPMEFPRHGAVTLHFSAPVDPGGSEWAAIVKLRDAVREPILRYCGEPDIG